MYITPTTHYRSAYTTLQVGILWLLEHAIHQSALLRCDSSHIIHKLLVTTSADLHIHILPPGLVRDWVKVMVRVSMVSRVMVSFRQFSKFLAYTCVVAIWHLLHIVNCTAPLVPMHRLIYLLPALYAMHTGQPCMQPLP